MRERDTSYSGWVIVGVSFITLALAYGVWYSFSVFFVALLEEFDWGRSVLAGAFSLCIIIHSLVGPFVGEMVDRWGPRRVISLGSLCLGIGLALCRQTQTWWQFYLFFGAITAIGIGAIGWVPNVILIQNWFKKQRGLAIGIISSGIGIGILVCIPTIQYLILQFGWRNTYGLMAISIPFIVISMALAFLKRSPQITPSPPAETEIPQAVVSDSLIINEDWASQSWSIRKAVTTKQFWLLSLSFFLGNFVTQSIFAHQVAFFVDRGLEALFASYIVGMIGIVSLGGKILWGGLSDRIGREITYTLGIACCILGTIILILFRFFSFPALTYFFSLFFGMGYAVTAALPPLIALDFFEGQAYGRIFGTLMVFIGSGGAFGAWFTGFIFDLTGSYVPAFVLLILCALFACFNIWSAAPRKIRKVPGRIRNSDMRLG
jgi:MFS family permease